jgi:hypothetical protein
MEMRLWPIHPQPQIDELLSSWMIRLAHANGYKAHSFYAQFFGRDRQIWTRDIDHHAPPWLLVGLSERTGVPLERIEGLTLRAFASFAFERFNESGTTRWIMPLSVYHRTRRAYGQQFCPMCLGEDEVCYLRRHWRLALSTVCIRHAVVLQDRCSECGRPLAPHRADVAARSGWLACRFPMSRCSYCREKLTGSIQQAGSEDVALQRHLTESIASGYVLIAGAPVYSHLYFDGLRLLMAGLHRIRNVGRSTDFERSPALTRLARLREAVDLVKRWPEEFLARCEAIRQPYTVFSKGAAEIPFWLASVLRDRLLSTRARISMEEARAIVEVAAKVSGRNMPAAARALSGRDVSRRIRAPSVDDIVARKVIAALDREIAHAPSDRRWLLLRDKVIFIAGRCLHLSVPKLLSLQTANFLAPAQVSSPSDAEVAATMLHMYAKHVRPHLASEIRVGALFISPAGTSLRASAIGMRFGRAVRAAHLDGRGLTWSRWASSRDGCATSTRAQTTVNSSRSGKGPRPDAQVGVMLAAAHRASCSFLPPA